MVNSFLFFFPWNPCRILSHFELSQGKLDVIFSGSFSKQAFLVYTKSNSNNFCTKSDFFFGMSREKYFKWNIPDINLSFAPLLSPLGVMLQLNICQNHSFDNVLMILYIFKLLIDKFVSLDFCLKYRIYLLSVT